MTAYDWKHRYTCEKCGARVVDWSGWRWCAACRPDAYAEAQRAAKRRYREKVKRAKCSRTDRP